PSTMRSPPRPRSSPPSPARNRSSPRSPAGSTWPCPTPTAPPTSSSGCARPNCPSPPPRYASPRSTKSSSPSPATTARTTPATTTPTTTPRTAPTPPRPDPPWVSFLVVSEAGGRQLGRVVVSVVGGLDLGWGAHVEFAVEPAVVPPPDPFQGRELDLLDRAPR